MSTRAGWLFLALAALVLAMECWARLANFSLTPDSLSYLIPALTYAQTGEIVFGSGREPGYRAILLGLTMLGGWSTDMELGRVAGWLQAALYVVGIAAVARELYLRRGIWPAALAVALFAVDRYHLQWVVTVQSEAWGRILILGGAALALAGLRRRSAGLVAGGFLLFGLIPLCRPSDLPWTLAMAVVPALWALADRRAAVWLRAGGLVALLLGPTTVYSKLHGAATGFSGLSERGPWHLAGRAFTVIPPERLKAAGWPDDVVERIARPIHDKYSPAIGTTRPVIDDLGRETPLVVHTIPTPRDIPLSAAQDYLGDQDVYRASQLLQDLAGKAIAAAPGPVLRAAAVVFADYATIPLLRPVYDASLRNKAFLLLPAVELAGLVLLAASWRRRPVVALGLGLAALGLLPLYFAVCAIGGQFSDRFAGHMHVFAALAALAAVCLPKKEGRE